MFNLPIKILKTVTLTAETIEVTFDDIATLVANWDAWAGVTSRHLVIISNARCVDPSDYVTQFLRFNGDLSNIYNYERLSGVNAAASAGRSEGANAINLPPVQGANIANAMGGCMVLIPHAFNTVNHKSLIALGGASEYVVEAVAGRWGSVAAITSVTLIEGVGDEYVVGSSFSIGVVDERYLVEEILDDGGGTFNNIPQGEGDLAVIGYLRTALAAVDDEVICAINDDTVVAHYPAQELVGRNGAASASQPNFEVGMVAAANATANVFGALAMTISQYAKDNQPHFLSQSGYHESTGATGEVRVMSGRRAITEPINKLYIAGANFDDFAAGSLISLYRVPKRIIQRVELTAPAANITFANIPQNFEALVLHVYARSDRAAVSDDINVNFNGDNVAANYDIQFLYGAAAVVTAVRNLASYAMLSIPSDTEGAKEYGEGLLVILGYSQSDRHKHVAVVRGRQENVAGINSCRWENIAAITQIVLTPNVGPNFLAGSVFELEGVLKKKGLPPSEGAQWGV